jgi:hypothetical protein
VRVRRAVVSLSMLILTLAGTGVDARADTQREPTRSLRPGTSQRLLSHRAWLPRLTPESLGPGSLRPGRLRYRGASIRLKDPGSGDQWYVHVLIQGRRTQLIVQAFSNEEDSSQSYSWDRYVRSGEVRVRRNLSDLSIHTGSSLGALGSVEVDLGSVARPRRDIVRCPRTGKVLFASTEARGRVEGAIKITPGLNGLSPEVSATHARVFLGRVKFRTSGCPGRGSRCFARSELSADDGETSVDVVTPHGSFMTDSFVTFMRNGVQGPLSTRWSLGVIANGSDLISRTPTSLTLDAAPLAPLLSGSLSFDLTGGSASAGARCSKRSEHYDWALGTLSATFDAGQVDLTGAGMRARFTRSRRP